MGPQLPWSSLGFQHVSTWVFIRVKTKKEWYSCGYRGWFRCIKLIPYDYTWEVCPISKLTCSKKFGLAYLVPLVSDHDMGLYVAAADKLKRDGGSSCTNLYKDQCKN